MAHRMRRAVGAVEVGGGAACIGLAAPASAASSACRRGLTAKPCSASVMAGSKSSRPGPPAMLPVRLFQHRSARPARRPHGRRPPASRKGHRLAVGSEEQAFVDRRPARSRGRPRPAAGAPSQCSAKAPPPMPLACGSTSVSTICTATAASTAEPPRCSTCTPASPPAGSPAETMKRDALCSTLVDAARGRLGQRHAGRRRPRRTPPATRPGPAPQGDASAAPASRARAHGAATAAARRSWTAVPRA